MTVYPMSEKLQVRAREWPTVESTMEDGDGTVRACIRCGKCENVISSEGGIRFADPEQANAFHLLTVHDYRLDGTQFGDPVPQDA